MNAKELSDRIDSDLTKVLGVQEVQVQILPQFKKRKSLPELSSSLIKRAFHFYVDLTDNYNCKQKILLLAALRH